MFRSSINPPPFSFNPRTRRGCDLGSDIFGQGFQCFNPRTRRGCDDTKDLFIHHDKGFNPRTRRGCDGRRL